MNLNIVPPPIKSALTLIGNTIVSSSWYMFFKRLHDAVKSLILRSYIDIKEDFGAKGDGVTDDTKAIQAAIDSLAVTTNPYGGRIYFRNGTYLISNTLYVYRGIQLEGESKIGTTIKCVPTMNSSIFKTKSITPYSTTSCHGVRIAHMTLYGTNDATKTLNHGLSLVNGVQHSTFTYLRILYTGGIGIDMGGDYEGGQSGALYNTISDSEVMYNHGYFLYVGGNTAQNTFNKVRNLYGKNHGVVFEYNQNNIDTYASAFMNQFYGGGVEMGGVDPGKEVYGVYFVSKTNYNAYQTLFHNFYIELWNPLRDDNTYRFNIAFKINAVSGVTIKGCMISFCEYGVYTDSIYTEFIEIEDTLFNQSETYPNWTNLANTSVFWANLSQNRIVLGTGCRVITAGNVLWPVTATASQVGYLWGHRDLDTSIAASEEITFKPKSALVANRPGAGVAWQGTPFFTIGPTNTADRIEYCIKNAQEGYQWIPVGEIWAYNNVCSFSGVNVSPGGTNSVLLGTTGMSNSRFIRLAPSDDFGPDAVVSYSPVAPSYTRITFHNTSNVNYVNIPANLWNYAVAVH